MLFLSGSLCAEWYVILFCLMNATWYAFCTVVGGKTRYWSVRLSYSLISLSCSFPDKCGVNSIRKGSFTFSRGSDFIAFKYSSRLILPRYFLLEGAYSLILRCAPLFLFFQARLFFQLLFRSFR